LPRGATPGHQLDFGTLAPGGIGILTWVVSRGVDKVSVVIVPVLSCCGPACCRCCARRTPEPWTPMCRSWVSSHGCSCLVAQMPPSQSQRGSSTASNMLFASSTKSKHQFSNNFKPVCMADPPLRRKTGAMLHACVRMRGSFRSLDHSLSGRHAHGSVDMEPARCFIIPTSAFYIFLSPLTFLHDQHGGRTPIARGLSWDGGPVGLAVSGLPCAAAGGGFDFDLSLTTTPLCFSR